jgi:predicted amidophosphoribosyltransferase
MRDAISRTLAISPAADFPIDAVLPVPLHPRKLRQRGFNQALELARVALGTIRGDLSGTPSGTSSGTPSGTPSDRSPRPTLLPTLERHVLIRTRHTRELGRSGPGDRRAEVFGAFGVSDPTRVAGRRFLVVDDVMTTGATLNECAETLIRAGATEVRVVALARAV